MQWPAGSNLTAALPNFNWQRTACPGIALSLSLHAPQVCTKLDSRTAGILYSIHDASMCEEAASALATYFSRKQFISDVQWHFSQSRPGTPSLRFFPATWSSEV